MSYKVIFDRNKCEDNLICVAVCNKFWKTNSNGKTYLKGAKEVKPGIFELVISDKDFECNDKARKGCPKNAIKVKKV